MAANKCRKRKNDETEDLKVAGDRVEEEHAVLVANAAALRSQVLDLKNELLKHGDCDCELIRTYIENAARRLV